MNKTLIALAVSAYIATIRIAAERKRSEELRARLA